MRPTVTGGRALLRVAASQSVRRPLQSALMVLGIALGVAVVVAIEMANASALSAFRLSTETLTGRATHQVVGGPTGLPADVYVGLRQELPDLPAAPVVDGLVAVAELGDRPFTLLGVDPLAEAPFRRLLGGAGSLEPDLLGRLLARSDGVLLSRGVAESATLDVGDRLALTVGSKTQQAEIVGLLDPENGVSREALDGLIVADIGAAQALLDRPLENGGRIDRIDLLIAPELEAASLEALDPLLPPEAAVVPSSEARASTEAMTEAFQLNLTALSLLALLVGMFLIFNTMRFNVLQRRATLGTLRSLGVTRREVFALVLAEALVAGVVGTGFGLGLGVLLGRGAVSLVSTTINDIYYVVTVTSVTVEPKSLLLAAGIGIGAAMVAAAVPAWEAARVQPVTAQRRSAVEGAAARAVGRTAVLALLAAIGAGLVLLIPGERVDLGFASLGLVTLSAALAAPAVTVGLMRLIRPAAQRLWPTLGAMAPRTVTRALSRTAVAIAALGLAVCVSIGVQLMVDSFRSTVEIWLAETLQADVFVSPPSVGAGRVTGALEPELIRLLRSEPGVAETLSAVGVTVRSPNLGNVNVVGASADIAGASRRYLGAIGPPEEVWAAVETGSVMITEPFARRHSLGVGDAVTLSTPVGPRPFAVAAVYADYASEQGSVLMSRDVYAAAFDDDRITSVALRLAEGVDAEAFVTRLRTEYSGAYSVAVQSNRALRSEALVIFDRAFTITGALRLLALVVAFIGVLSALMSLQLERSRELATLRATGLTEHQLTALSLLETGLMGLAAGILSLPAGAVLAGILIHVINRRSFGWTLEATLDPWVFVQALAVALTAAMAAGVVPALRLRRLPIARALREE